MQKKLKVWSLFISMILLVGCQSTAAFNDETLILREIKADEQVFTTTLQTKVTELEGLPELEYAAYDGDGIEWIASFVEGKPAAIHEDYMVTTDATGKEISRTAVLGSKKEIKAIAPKMQFGGEVSVGSEFYPTMLTYGVDCVGCNVNSKGFGGTSAGVTVGVHSVKQPDGSFKEGIKYGDYYIVAADPSIPLCSTMTVYNHGFSGEGIQPGVPFKVIVLDRGGSIKGNVLDFFKGSEKKSNIKNNRYVNTKVVINRVGGQVSKGVCKV